MFWRFGFHTQSAIDTLLDKDEVTLEELLDEEELMQECKSHNRKLLDFICRADVLEALLAYIVEQPADDVDETLKYKYPALSAEIFGCEVLTICDALIKNEALLSEFWKFIEQPHALNPIQGSYFCRVMIVLLSKKTSETVRFIQSQESPLQHLLNHIDTSSVMDLVEKLISCEELKETRGVLDWALDQGLVSLLVDKFDPNLSPESHSNAADLLNEVMGLVQRFGTHNPIIEQLKSPQIQTKLLDFICQKDAPNLHSALVAGLNVEIELIQRSLGADQDTEMYDQDFKPVDLSDFMAVLEPKLGALHEIMLEAKPPGVTLSIMESTPEKPLPLGALRLKIVEFLVVLLNVDNPAINRKILELNIVPCYIELFFKYQWNNFLHSYIHDMIVKIFVQLKDGKDLMVNVLNDGKLTERIAEASKENETEIEGKKGFRRGYMGHLTLISNLLVKFSELPNLPQDIVQSFQGESWQEYYKQVLSETNQRDNKPLGGHRPVLTSDDDMFQAQYGQGDSNLDQFEDDDDYEPDDEIVEKPGSFLGAHGGHLRSSFYDDSDDEEPHSDSWAFQFNEEKDLNGPKSYSESSFD